MLPTSVAPELGDPAEYPYVFRIAPSATVQATSFVEYAKASGWSRIGLLAVNNALGSTSADAVVAEVEGTDLEVVGRETHESGAVDLGPQVSSLKRANADVVLVLNVAIPDMAGAVKARNAIEWEVPMLGFSPMANPLVGEAVGAGGMDNVHAGQNYRNLTGEPPANTRAFLDLMREHLGEDVLTRDMSQSAGSYSGLSMMAAAIEKVGSADDPDALKEALESGSPWKMVQGTFEYSADEHSGSPLETLVFVIASSFDDGLYQLSPNQ
jgi:branched-chain amino acid transport system substrate-binding protein